MTVIDTSDVGNAEQFIRQFGDELLYCPEMRVWYVWDGKRWQPDTHNQVLGMAKQVADGYERQMEEQGMRGKERQRVCRHIQYSRSLKGLNAMMQIAQADGEVVCDVGEFDRNPMLLNVDNGTVDLETGEWREYKANDYITNRAAVAYTRGAVNRRWEEFVARVMPDTGVREFVQTAVGYSLTGLTNEDKLFILHGNGCNGKSTFTSTILNMLGTYGAQASSELLLRKRASGPSNDMFVLLGKRFVSATETGETCQLDENLVKQMTGGERVSVNPKYKSQIEFTPSWKTWLSTNHEPVIRGTDEAIWRRLVLVPFNVTIGKSHRDPKLRTHLANNYEGRAGILNWALEGVIKWVRNGLIIPTQISDATAHYRQSQDPIGQFMQEMCHISQNVMVRKGVLYDAYCQFCLKNHDQPRTKNAFSRYMHFRRIGESRDMDARFWVGIELDNSVSILPGDAE